MMAMKDIHRGARQVCGKLPVVVISGVADVSSCYITNNRTAASTTMAMV